MVVVSNTSDVPVEGVLQQVPSTKLFVNDQELGTATLYITENNVLWMGGVRPGGGNAPALSLLYPTISLHAIQRDPTPALYMVVNYELGLTENPGDDDDDEYDADNEPMTQLRFIPPSEDDLQAMYTALCQGQALHPDPNDSHDDDPYMDGEEFHEGDEEFEDAEESEGQEQASPSPEDAARRLRQMHIQSVNGVQNHEEETEGDEIGEE